MTVCRYGCILVVLLVMAIFTMSEGSRIIKIGYDVTKMENELAKLSEEGKKLRFKSDKLKRPEMISLKVKGMKLDLIVQEEESIAIVKKSHKSLNKSLSGKVEA
jgi:cell division protein FtsL